MSSEGDKHWKVFISMCTLSNRQTAVPASFSRSWYHSLSLQSDIVWYKMYLAADNDWRFSHYNETDYSSYTVYKQINLTR